MVVVQGKLISLELYKEAFLQNMMNGTPLPKSVTRSLKDDSRIWAFLPLSWLYRCSVTSWVISLTHKTPLSNLLAILAIAKWCFC